MAALHSFFGSLKLVTYVLKPMQTFSENNQSEEHYGRVLSYQSLTLVNYLW